MAIVGPRHLHHVPLSYHTILDPLTAAQAIVGQAAVAARDGTRIPIVATNDDVRNTPITQGWKLNNSALKYLRDFEGENPRGVPVGPIELTGSFIHQIGVIVKTHDGTDQGMDYSWKPDATTPWSWKQMFAQMPADMFAKIVGANHICRITLEPVPGACDQKRHHAAKICNTQVPFPDDAPVPVWGFHVLTSDGRVHRFHPDYTKRRAATSLVLGVANNLPAPPDAGRGGSDGLGTYRRITDGNYDVVERKGGGKGKGKPTQSTVVEAIEDVPPTPGTSTVVHAIEDEPATRAESTVVEKGKAGKAGGKQHTSAVVQAVAEHEVVQHKSAVAEATWEWSDWNTAGHGSSSSSSIGWGQGWKSAGEWKSYWE